MKQYTSRELSEKLVKLGCKSQSGLCYFSYDTEGLEWFGPQFEIEAKRVGYCHEIQAFEFEDFCGTHAQARENCRIIWPDTNEDGTLSIKYIMNNPKKTAVLHWEYHRHKMVDSEDWLKYLEKVIENLTPEEPTH